MGLADRLDRQSDEVGALQRAAGIPGLQGLWRAA